MDNHKILYLYNKSIENSIRIEKKRDESVNNIKIINTDNLKKIIEIDYDWELMEQFFEYDGFNEKNRYRNWYKNYIIKLFNIPTSFIPFVKFSILFQFDNSDISVQEYFSRNLFIFVSSEDTSNDTKNIIVYIPFEKQNQSIDSNEKQIYTKLMVKIYNPHYFE